ASRREIRSSSRSDFTTGDGGFSASSVFGLVARSGSQPGSGGPSSCSGPPNIHIDQTMHEGNYAPYNFLTIFSDGFITVWLLILLYLYHRWVGFQNQVSPLRHSDRFQREYSFTGRG